MPIGLLVPVVAGGWGAACALTCWRRLGVFARVPALVANELPFAAGYLLIASLALALAQGDLDMVGGAVVGSAGLVVLVGLVVIIRRGLRAHRALGNPDPPRRPWHRILCAPLPAVRRDVTRARNLSYARGRRRRLDVYCRRDRPSNAPVVVHFHGGGFHSGNKNREARPLIGHLVSTGKVCVSANYRLQPHVSRADQVADVQAAIEWVKVHAAAYGGDPSRLFLVGSSAGVYLAIDALNHGASGVAGLICRYGYYGDLAPARVLPPMLVIHGENDLYVRPATVRAFVDRVRACSVAPVEYRELPGAHHDFDLYESIRSAAVNVAAQSFIDRIAGQSLPGPPGLPCVRRSLDGEVG
jgi:acetyl esterase/lipase